MWQNKLILNDVINNFAKWNSYEYNRPSLIRINKNSNDSDYLIVFILNILHKLKKK